MIKRRIEDIIADQPVRPPKRGLSKTAIGSALAISITMFMLKYDIIKNHFEVRTEITDVRRAVEDLEQAYEQGGYDTVYISPPPAPSRTEPVRSAPEQTLTVVRPCYQEVSTNTYEVIPCTTTQTGN